MDARPNAGLSAAASPIFGAGYPSPLDHLSDEFERLDLLIRLRS